MGTDRRPIQRWIARKQWAAGRARKSPPPAFAPSAATGYDFSVMRLVADIGRGKAKLDRIQGDC